jgi:hypothetical protein
MEKWYTYTSSDLITVYRYNLPVECLNPTRHSATTNIDLCRHCNEKWVTSLPWYPESPHIDDDTALLSFLKISEEYSKRDRYRMLIQNVWKDVEGMEGYTAEVFGLDVGEADDPDAYPWWRIKIPDKPKLIVRQLSTRLCYEPQQTDYPIFLEVKFSRLAGYFISIKGLHRDLDISSNTLRPILRAREFMFKIDRLSFLGLKSQRFIEKAKRFTEAARRLAEEGKSFTIPNLLKESRYRSRNSWYSFIEEIAADEGKGKAERIESLVKDQYDAALAQSQGKRKA